MFELIRQTLSSMVVPGFGGSWNVQLTNQRSTSTFRHPAGIVVQTSSREAQVLRQQK